jgi:hypothetical protein
MLEGIWIYVKEGVEFVKQSLFKREGSEDAPHHPLRECVEIILGSELAKQKVLELFRTELDKAKGVLTIENIGLDFSTIHSTFSESVQQMFRDKAVAYRGLIIDPESPMIAAVTAPRKVQSNVSTEIATSMIALLLAMGKDTGDRLKYASIEVKSYTQVPVIHGFLIAKDHLILGFTHFRGGGLRGGDHPYLYVRRNERSEFISELFNVYGTWFEHLWGVGTHRVGINADLRSGDGLHTNMNL